MLAKEGKFDVSGEKFSECNLILSEYEFNDKFVEKIEKKLKSGRKYLKKKVEKEITKKEKEIKLRRIETQKTLDLEEIQKKQGLIDLEEQIELKEKNLELEKQKEREVFEREQAKKDKLLREKERKEEKERAKLQKLKDREERKRQKEEARLKRLSDIEMKKRKKEREHIERLEEKKKSKEKPGLSELDDTLQPVEVDSKGVKIKDETDVIDAGTGGMTLEKAKREQIKELIRSRQAELDREREEIEAELDANLKDLHERALKLYKKKQYRKSLRIFEEINGIRPEYQKTDNYIEKIDEVISDQKERGIYEDELDLDMGEELMKTRKDLISESLDLLEQEM